MANFMVLFKKNLIEMVRNKRIIVFSAVFVILALISALTAKYIPVLIELLLGEIDDMLMLNATVADSYVQFISNFGQIAVLLIGIMFASAITKEKSKGTYDSLKMNGVKDYQIVLSHLVAQIVLVTVSYLLSVAFFSVLNILLFRQIMGMRGFVSLVYIYLVMLATICFSLFCSCICKKSGKAYLFVILSYFILGIVEIIPKVNMFNPFHLLTLSTNLMYYENYSLKEHLITSLVSFVICVVLVVLSLLLVRNRINNKKVIASDKSRGI